MPEPKGGDREAYSAYDAVSIPMLAMRAGQLIYVNAAWEALFGISGDEVLGRSATQLIGQADRGRLQHLHQYLLPGESVAPELWVRLQVKSGEQLTSVHSSPGVAKDETLYLLVAADEEGRAKTLTEALSACSAALVRCRTEDELLRLVLDALEEQGFACGFLFIVGEYLRQGPVRQPPDLMALFERVLGPLDREMLYDPKQIPFVADIFRTGRALFQQDFLRALAHLYPPEFYEGARALRPVLRGVHAPIFVEQQMHGILSAQSPNLSPSQAAAIELFATQVGSALENVRHHLRAQERLGQLERLQSEMIARERLTVLGEAAAVLAHEIQNPLGAILNGVSLLKVSFPQGAELLRMVEEEAFSLDRLTHDMLDYAKPLTADPAEVPVQALIDHAIAQVRSRPPGPRVSIRALPLEGLETLWGDVQLLRLALSNLLRNAVQASPFNGEVRLWAERAPKGVKLVVEDSGPGIAPESRSRIFEPFFTTRVQGSGLGLALVERVVRLHQGTIEVSDAEPRGARFELFVPGKPAPVPAGDL